MSPHNTRYKNKATRATWRSPDMASKHSPPSSKSTTKPKSPPRSKSSSPSSSVHVPSSSSLTTSASGAAAAAAAAAAIGKPKRPLSAYNLFFKFARDEMLASTASSGTTTGYDHSKHATTLQSPGARRDLSKKGRPPPHRKIGFAEMARQIGAKWKALEDDRREHFEALARVDKQRYLKEMEAWKAAGGDKQLQQKEKKDPSKSTGVRKSPPSSPKGKKSSTKKSKVDALNVTKSTCSSTSSARTTKPTKQPEQHEVYSHEDYLSYHVGAPYFAQQQQQQQQQIPICTFDNIQTTLNQACDIAGAVSNIPRTVSARSSINSSSAESLYRPEYTNASASMAKGCHDSMIEPYMHHHQGYQQPYTSQHFDFHPPAAVASSRRVSEGNDGGDFLPDTLYSAVAHYNSQQHSYGDYRNHWQHHSGQLPNYPYQRIAPGGVAPSSIQREHEIGNNDDRDVSISSTSSDAKVNKIVSSNWNASMGDYLDAAANRADASLKSNEIGLPTKTSLSYSSGSVVAAHKNSDHKWSDIDDTDRLLDVLGKIDDEDVKFWGAANPMA